MEKPVTRADVLKEALQKGEEKKRRELDEKGRKRAEILRGALKKEPEEITIELEPEEPKPGEGMPEELKEKLKTPEEHAEEAEKAVEEKVAGYKEKVAEHAEKLKKAAESAEKLAPKLKKMREEIFYGKKGEAGTIAEISKNLEASEAEWEKKEEDLDWLAREREAEKILGESGVEAVERMRREAAGEIEAEIPPEKALEPREELSGGWSDAGGAEGGEEIFELTKKKEKAPKGVIAGGREAIPPKQEKLSLTELDDRVNALWSAMDEILRDAASYEFQPGEKKKIKKWAKKGQGVEDWPLDDRVTPENYKERLKKYGIADLIDPSKIESHNDAYAVVSKQYKRYRDELEKRVRHAKLRQLENLEEEGASSPVIAGGREAIPPEKEEVIPLTKKKEKKKKEKLSEESVDIDVSEFEEPEEETEKPKGKETKKQQKEKEKNIKTAIIKKPKKKKGFFSWLRK